MSTNMEANNVNNTKKNTAGSKINAYQICLVALAVGINIAGGQIALLLKLPVYLDSIGTILTGALLGPWFGMLAKSDQRNLHGNDSRYLFPVFCAGRNDHRYYEWSCISQTVRKEGKSAGGSCNDHCPGNSGKFCNQRSAVWRSYFFRIFNSGAASFTYTTWPDRKHFCSSVPDRLSRSLHRSFCSQCICDHAQWRNETETDGKCE